MRDLRGTSGRLASVALVLGTTLLAGCSGGSPAASGTLPTGGASSSSSPAPETLPPLGPAEFPVPAEARTEDAAGAEAFLRYWVDLIDRQRTIPAGQPLRDLGPNCQECQRIAQNYDEAASAGNRYVGGELTLNDVTEPVFEGEQAVLSFGVRREGVSLVNESGGTIDQLSENPNAISGITLTWSSEHSSWLVQGFNVG